MDNNIHLKQHKSISLTPQLKESINILKFSNIELIPYVKIEIEQNPFLDYKEISYEDTYPQYASSYYTNKKHFQNNIEQLSEKSKSLYQYLVEQINICASNPVELSIAFCFINIIDKNGYIEENAVEKISNQLSLKKDIVESVLFKLQSLEPTGIFARNLSECLALQLKEKNLYNYTIEKLITNLSLLANYKLEDLEKICKTSKEDIMEMYKEIKKLNPRPGNSFSQTKEGISLPDIILYKDSDGNFQLKPNDEAFPKIIVNKNYYSKIFKNTKDKSEKNFLSEKISTASWLYKSLEQRMNTIMKVATEIISRQKKFFLNNDINYIKPMKLSDIAESIQMNSSTISRAINGKFLYSDIGIFELKYFFSNSVKNSYIKEKISNKTAQHVIKEIIANETVSSVFSDEDLVKLLQEQGIDIARRTVAKYRAIYSIPSSSVRKKKYQMMEYS